MKSIGIRESIDSQLLRIASFAVALVKHSQCVLISSSLAGLLFMPHAQAAAVAPDAAFIDNESSSASYNIPPGYLDAHIGRGFDSATNEVKEQCIVFADREDELTTVLPRDPAGHEAIGQLNNTQLTDFTDAEEMLAALSINASASFNTGAYRGDLSVSYATSKTVNRFSESLIIVESIENPHRFLKKAVRTKEATARLNDPFTFRKYCGDRYIIGIVTGGYFAAVVNASTDSEKEQRDLKIAFSVSASSGSADLTTNSTYRDLVTHGRLSVKILRKGPKDNVPETLEAVRQYSQDLPGKVAVASNQWPILMTTKAYGALGPSLTGSQGLFLSAAGIQYMRLKRLASGLEYINAHHGLFGGFDQSKYKIEHDTAEQDANLLEVAASNCAKDPKRCPSPSFARPRELPARIDWKDINAKEPVNPIGDSQGNENLVVEAHGQFGFCAGICEPGHKEWWTAAESGFIHFHDRNTGLDREMPANRTYRVPDFTTVTYKIYDSYYPDNRSHPTDKLQAAIYEPVYSLPIDAVF